MRAAHSIVNARVRVWSLAIAAMASSALPAGAQTGGVVSGQVTESGNQRPLAGVQMSIPGTGLGGLTNSSGQYQIANVPAGTQLVRAQLIGYASAERSVAVPAGGRVTVSFQLTQSAISLNQIVVTGAAGATEMRKVGNTISSINAAQITASRPIVSFDELIKGRASGVNMLPTSGQVGTGGLIRIRGQVSLSQTNSPLIYVDGVRVDNSKDSGIGLGGQGLSRLQDINPADIERVEIIKGAAATTLYGTEASAGVMQIFTKRGAQGQARWTFQTEHGLERVSDDVFEGDLYPKFVGPTGLNARNPSELVETGRNQAYQLSVGGGGEGMRYYLAGGMTNQQGSITPDRNHMRQVNVRANFTALPLRNLTLNMSTGYTNSNLRIPDGDNGLYGFVSAVHLAVPYTATEARPWGETFNPLSANRQLENYQRVHHLITGLTADYQPRKNIRSSLGVGLDVVDEESTKYFPFGFTGSGNTLGLKANANRTRASLTSEVRTILSHAFSEKLTTETAVGAQLNHESNIRVFAQGEEFPAPGVSTVGAGARKSATETRITEVNAGLFLQETVGLFDQLFLTGGLRLDGNSAFGTEFKSQLYPKLSAAYTISGASFWPKALWPSMKLRAAWGTSGLAPAQFAADRTYLAIAAVEGLPAVTPGNIGDPELGPERSSEIEVGFDAGLFGDRLGITVTRYWQTTKDALVPAQFPPSLGFRSTQLKNIGEVQNRGFEVMANSEWLSRTNLNVRSNIQFSTQTNEVTDMGGVAPLRRGFNQLVKEGYPAASFWRPRIVSWDPVTRRHIKTDTLEYIGTDAPKFLGSFSTDITIFKNLTFSGLADWATGHYQQNATRGFRIQFLTGDEYLRLVEQPTGKKTPAADSLLNFVATLGSTAAYIEKADFLKLRELGVTYAIPDRYLGSLGLKNSSLRLSGRNLWMTTKYTGIDPEARWDGRDDFTSGAEFFTVPPARRVTLSFRTNY